MSEKIVKRTLPKTEAALNMRAKSVHDYAEPRVEGVGAIWTDIPLPTWMSFKTAFAIWTLIYEKCQKPHLPGDTEAKHSAETELRRTFTELMDRGLLLAPRTSEDLVSMGFEFVDDTRTVITEVTDTVNFGNILNGPVAGSHVHIVPYNITGKKSRAKAPYHLAVFQMYIQGPDDPPPILEEDKWWGKDILSKNEPFEHHHKAEDVGKIAHYRARWETANTVVGPWTMTNAQV
jgi:hypothetical protein